MAEDERQVSINISAIPVAGIGGLGLVAMATVVSVFFPAIGWMMAAGVASGVLLGAGLVAYRRVRKGSGPSGDNPRILFEASDAATQERPPDGSHLLKLSPYSTL